MIGKKRKIELLAPAKNKECAFAAINAGADAIYLGAEAFGARKNAGNSIEDIKEIVNYAHIFDVKVYITLNTILFDNEIKEVEKLVWKLYELKIDAIIFQDFAFFEMNLPPIALHASTQCNNDKIDKIKFLKSMNVERVVLPREFSINEIKNVVNSVKIETEVFVHGALCVSFSGQCYFSNHIGGRSANRGECAQPCRKKYSLADENGRIIVNSQYLLSMKDNNQSAHLKELIDAGVTSLKIEGRLKDKEYVENIVAFYRKALDEIGDVKISQGILKSDFKPDANKTFNRSYTDFYFDEKRKTFINPLTPKFLGEYVGKIKAINGKTLTIDSKTQFNAADKLAFVDKQGNLSGTTVTKVQKGKIEVLNVSSLEIGTKLYRNFDAEFFKSLKKAGFSRKLPITIEVFDNKIAMSAKHGVCVEILFKQEFEIAKNVEKAVENAAKQLCKLGETEFVCEKVKFDDDFKRFIPISSLNELRREAAAALKKKILESYCVNQRKAPKTAPNYPFETLDYSFNISNAQSKAFYEKCGCVVEESAPECKKSQKCINLMTTKHCLRDFAGICKKKTKDNKDLFLIDEFGVKYPLEFDCKNCVMKIKSP